MKRILVPTDLSDLATRALRHAGTIALHSGAEITVLYADTFLPPPHFTSEQIPELVKNIEQSKAAAKEVLARNADEALPPAVRRRTLVVERAPVDAILDTATELDADLIVMGTHGRSGFNRLMLGSVTEKVLRQTRRPLLTTRWKDGAAPEPRRILVPTDLSPISGRAFAHALEHSALFDSAITLLHVVAGGDEPESKAWSDFTAFAAADAKIERRIERGNVAGRVLEIAEEISADLIVLGIEHKAFRDTMVLGTDVLRVIRHAEMPVVAVP
ncbi:MAG TPA: universal stress protein [Thermoanaerobaculia bacterium]|nr:universal stress protein [Thermoanaerobaculia bacterium]